MIRILSGGWGLLAGSAALALSFPSPSLFPLAWVCVIPLLLNLLQTRRAASAAGLHFLFFVPAYGLILYWIPGVMTGHGGLSFPGAFAIFGLLVTGMSVLMLPFSMLTWLSARIWTPRAALLAAPAVWTACELFRGHFVVGGFPWGSLGYSQQGFGALLQAADIGGVYLLSFLVVSGNSTVLLWTLFQGRGPGLAYGILIVSSLVYGTARLEFWELSTDPARSAALVQPGIELKGSRSYFRNIYFEQLPALYEESCRAGAEWIFFPEAPNPYPPERDGFFLRFWTNLVSARGCSLALNATGGVSGGAHFNSVFFLDKTGGGPYRYDKRRLVPFGEYLPAGSHWLGLSRAVVREVGNFSPGRADPEPAGTGDELFSFLLCYESIFPELSRRSVLAGARFLVNLTNDLWFGDTAAPHQHLQMAALRAVELRKPLLRVANSGISAHIDSWGRIREKLELFEVGRLVVRFAPNSYRTHFARFGQGTVGFIIMIALLGAAADGTWSRRKGGHGGKLS